MLHSYFNKFLIHYSEEVIKYGYDIPALLQFCLDFNTSQHTSFHTNLSPAFSDVSVYACSHDTDTSAVVRSSVLRNIGPIPLTNLKKTCYINSILQILFQINNYFSFECWNNHLFHIDDSLHSECIEILVFRKFLDLCKKHKISRCDLTSLMDTLNKYNPFFDSDVQRDALEAFTLLLEAFNIVCRKPKAGYDFPDIPEYMNYYFLGFFEKKFICTSCLLENSFHERFYNVVIQPSDDVAAFLGNQRSEQNNFTCDKCLIQSLQNVHTEIHEFPRILTIQVNRFSESGVHHRQRKNTQSMSVYESVKFGLVEYTLFGLIEHKGVLVDSGHYTCRIFHNQCWYYCNDITIEKAVLPGSSQNVYLLFYYRK